MPLQGHSVSVVSGRWSVSAENLTPIPIPLLTGPETAQATVVTTAITATAVYPIIREAEPVVMMQQATRQQADITETAAVREVVTAPVPDRMRTEKSRRSSRKSVLPPPTSIPSAVTRRRASLITAIIDENVKAVEGSRVRLRLLDDVEIGDLTVKKGTYLYATMSGFGQQRVKGTIQSIFYDEEIIKVSLSIYDTDGLEGLYVPESEFRSTAKDIGSSAMSGGQMLDQTNTSGTGIRGWASQAAQNASQKVMSAFGKIIKTNRVKLKYGTKVYLVDGSQSGSDRGSRRQSEED